MTLQVIQFEELEPFASACGAFLLAREAEHNLLLGIMSHVRRLPEQFARAPPRYALVRDGAGTVVAATLRTPPWNQVLSQVDDPDALDLLADALRDDVLPGVLGPTEAAARFADRWSAATGRTARLATAERVFRLERVVPPARMPPGRWRPARPDVRAVLVRWLLAFHDEAAPHSPLPDDPEGYVERGIAGIGRHLYVWEDGAVTSLVTSRIRSRTASTAPSATSRCATWTSTGSADRQRAAHRLYIRIYPTG